MKKSQFLVATDSEELFEQVKESLLDENVRLFWARSGAEAMAVAKGSAQNQNGELIESPDLMVFDMQIGNMGGVAIFYDLYLEMSAGRVPKIPLVLLLDREADIFLAKEIKVDAFLVKPIDYLQLRRLVEGLVVEQPAEVSAST